MSNSEAATVSKTPVKGEFYYHYKRDPLDSAEGHAYEIVGIAHHTENRECLVIYRPLYWEAFVFGSGKDMYACPLGVFGDDVWHDSRWVPRFTKIKDPAVISKLQDIREKLRTQYLNETFNPAF
jgi:hypothetical protein